MTKEEKDNLEKTLYEDAERRRFENQQKKKEIEKERSKPKEQRFKNENSDKYVISRFDKELNQVQKEVMKEELQGQEV